MPYQRYFSYRYQYQGQHWGGSGCYLSLSLNTSEEQAVQWREWTRVAVCLLLWVHCVLVPQPNCPSTSSVAQHTATLRKAVAGAMSSLWFSSHQGNTYLYHPCTSLQQNKSTGRVSYVCSRILMRMTKQSSIFLSVLHHTLFSFPLIPQWEAA